MAWDTVPAPAYPTPNPYYVGNALGNLVSNYQQAQQGQQRTQANDLRNQQDQQILNQSKAFAGGLPTNPDGTPNYSAIMKTLAEKGDINAIGSLAPILQQQQNLQGANAPDPIFGVGGGSSGASGGFIGALHSAESGDQNVYSKVDPDPAGPGTRSQGYDQINVPTWQQFAPKAGVDLSQYPTPMSAPKDVQDAVVATIPLARFGPRTRQMLESEFGFGDDQKSETVGQLASRFGGGGKDTLVASLDPSDALAYANPDQPSIPPVSAAAGSSIPRADASTEAGAVGGSHPKPSAVPPQLAANNPAWGGINAALPVGSAPVPAAAALARAARPPAAPAQGSVASLVSSAVGDPQRASLVARNIGQLMGVDPGAPLTPAQADRVKKGVQAYIARTGQQQPSGGQGQPSPGEPIVPRYLQQMGLTDPQQAIQAIDQDIARLSRLGPAANGRIRALEDIRNGIEKRAAPPKFGVIGKDQYGQPTYGWINPQTQTITPAAPIRQQEQSSPPGVSDVHGGDFLKTVDPNMANQVKALSEGRMQFPSGFALKSPYWQKMLQLVAQYDPSFDAVEYNARARARTDATSGKLAQNNNALNTGIGHVWQLAQAVDALHNGNWQSMNAVKNWWNAEFGGTAPTNFEAIRDRVAPEITKVWRGAGGAESDIKRDIGTLSTAKSPAQLYGALSEIAGLMQSKIEANEAQYGNIMGPMAGKLQMITPQSQEVLKRLESYSQPRQSGAGGVGPVAACVGIDWRVFGRHEAIRSRGEFNGVIVWLLGEGLPSVDLAHGDLS